ncbi:nitrogen regulatory protein P-II [Spirochaetia bacterium]|nr:nitrogen regulatory protein P-II [Spirochaetia bacterium]
MSKTANTQNGLHTSNGLTKSDGARIPVLKGVIFIVDWERTKGISEVFERTNVRFHFIGKGKGTANSEILEMLGIGSSEKAVFFCLEQDRMAAVLLKEGGKTFSHTPGIGIGFTIPLSGINTPILQVFKQSVEKDIKIHSGEETEKMNTEIKYGLIAAVVNKGYSDEFMAAAREAGARGGTVINARGLAHQGPVKFFGISVQEEKEIIMILTTRAQKTPIMQAVSQAYGVSSKAGGIIFSLPVEDIVGLNLE